MRGLRVLFILGCVVLGYFALLQTLLLPPGTVLLPGGMPSPGEIVRSVYRSLPGG